MSISFPARWPALGLTLTALVLAPAPALALPVTAGHPRVYVDSVRIAEIQAALDLAPPLSGTAFPQRAGTIEFDIRPRPLPDGETQTFERVFDSYSTTVVHPGRRQRSQVERCVERRIFGHTVRAPLTRKRLPVDEGHGAKNISGVAALSLPQ